MDRSIQFRYSRVARGVHGAVPPRQNRAGSSIYPPSGSGTPRATLLVLAALFLVTAFQTANAQDLLRRSAPVSTGIPTTSSSNNTASAASRAAAAQAAQASQNARDALRRTTQAIDAVKAMQAAARATAAAANNLGINPKTGFQLPNVPNGLRTGGLDLLTIKSGAQAPVESVSGATTNVTIKQTSQQALLHWTTFNVGRDTALYFDQTAGGSDSGNWIAYNKIFDPAGNPSQILGSIKADGQVYVMNPNGVIFGANSQVNARGLTASSLPLNDNLREAGLLNNPDAQFLFSGLSVPGTPTFDPNDPARSGDVPVPSDGKFGDVTVQAGAQLFSPVSADGTGGRIMLVGANVRNDGTISTPNGQTILAAGLQVGVQAHDTNDPSLRGMDVWVGAVADPHHASLGSYSGTVVNSGAIESYLGSVTLAGRNVQQLGSIDSSTSVALNGRIDISSSYGAVGNPLYDNSGSAAPQGVPFLFQETGTIAFGSGSVTRILPDYASSESVPGSALPEASQINVEGLAVHLECGAMILAPNGNVTLRAGTWPYKDVDGNRTIQNGLIPGALDSNNLQTYVKNGLLFDQGQVYFDEGSFVNVAGSTDVYVPLSQSILTLKFTGPELAESPLQRTGAVKGVDVTVDIRNSGTYNGQYWVGTPLADVTGFVNLIEHNAAQLTLSGGNVTIQAGNSAVMQRGSVIDVSGGYATHEGGLVQTSKLIAGTSLIDIADATPDRVYDGVYTPMSTRTSDRWKVSQTFRLALAPESSSVEPSYVEGGSGGTLKITAPALALDGTLLGSTVTGPRQRTVPPQSGSLQLSIGAQELFSDAFHALDAIVASPNPPRLEFVNGATGQTPAAPFTLVGGSPTPLSAERLANVYLSADLVAEGGFGNLTVSNPDGDVVVPAGVTVQAPVFGSVSFTGANVTVDGQVIAPGGSLNFRAFNLSPNALAKLPPSDYAPAPNPNPNRGSFTLGPGGVLSTAGLYVDERFGDTDPVSQLLVVNGGSVAINSLSANIASESVVDVSGGISLDARAKISYGKGGSISILTGKDPNLGIVRGGSLTLGGTLLGYSGGVGGTLGLQATAIQVGGTSADPRVLLLQPSLFQQGGFTNFSITGIGGSSSVPASPGAPDNYLTAIFIAPGTLIEPRAEQFQVNPSVGAKNPLQVDRILAPEYLRIPANLEMKALGSDDPFTTSALEVRGDIVMGAGSRIATDPRGSVSFNGQTVTLLGSVLAPGGTIDVSGAGTFPLAPADAALAVVGLPTVHLGAATALSAAGTTVLTPDPYGRRTGTVYDGGTINVSGNIVAEAGSVLDVAGATALLDVSNASLGISVPTQVTSNSGLTALSWSLQTLPVQIDSNGGGISLRGSQMLYSDATLHGQAGGITAVGGTLSVFSSRFYSATERQTGADINVVVTQSGRSLASTNTSPGIGRTVLDSNGAALPGMGCFVAERFLESGFGSLDLGATYLPAAAPVAYGGNVRFQGPVSLAARGSIRLAGGGVIEANAPVNLSANYLHIGQPFQSPVNPKDSPYLFSQSPDDPVTFTQDYRFAPTFGFGNLSIQGQLIDVGTLSLQNIGRANFNAGTGDIRGNGTVDIAGDLSLEAGKIYPTSLSSFNVFAYDHGATQGSVTIGGSGSATVPLSAGGSLNVFASVIQQGGTLRAPLGSITLGWDGTGTAPQDRIAGGLVNQPVISVPVTSSVTLKAGSVISVSAVDSSGSASLIPYGLSSDGLSWSDPSGVNVTISGLPTKGITVAGKAITSEAGSTIDIRGGGDLFAYSWVRGNGGAVDLLGTAAAEWNSSASYEAGDLVTYNGQTWSARVGHTGQQPTVNRYWSLVPDSFAVIPGYQESFAPYSANNTGTNAGLGGDPGYVDNGLKLGDRIYLDASPGLAAGYYTLLPRGYARLPGAFLVTPKQDEVAGTITMPDGASYVSGYRYNQFDQPPMTPSLRQRFEVAPPSVVTNRVQYDNYLANTFIPQAAQRLALDTVQRIPMDAGALSIQGSMHLSLQGSLLAGQAQGGRGSLVDLSSGADVHIIGDSGTAPMGSAAVLDVNVLNSWGVESLLIGGLRRKSADGTSLDVRTSNITLDDPGATLSSPEITMVSKGNITVTDGSAIRSTGALAGASAPTSTTGNGALIRVSGDANASNARDGVTNPSTPGYVPPLLSVGAGVHLEGASVILDSSHQTSLDLGVSLDATSLTLGSGQISVLFQNPGGTPAGSALSPHLVLSDALLSEVQQAGSLTLESYRTIDFYGTGSLGTSQTKSLRLLAGGIRGYSQGSGSVLLAAEDVLFGNPSGASALSAPPGTSGAFQVNAGTVRLRSNSLSVAGYQDVNLTASKGMLGQGSGLFSTAGNLSITTPVIAGQRGATYAVTSTGAMVLESSGGPAGITPELGASFAFTGSTVTANTSVLLPSGALTLQATGDVKVGGQLNVGGSSQAFYDVVKYADAGQITLNSANGNVFLQPGSLISVAASSGGGNAGKFSVSAPNGGFDSLGALLGTGSSEGKSGSFSLDTGALASYATIRDQLVTGGFTDAQSFRLRTGSAILDGTTGANQFSFSADWGSILVSGTIDASGKTGGSIALTARDDVVVQSGARLTVAAQLFNDAGKGGSIDLEAGSEQSGSLNPNARLSIQSGSLLDVSVAEYVPGDYNTVGSSAFGGKFAGTLHLRAHRVDTDSDGYLDLGVDPIQGRIAGASSVLVEGYQLYDRTVAAGVLNIALRNQINSDAQSYLSGTGETKMWEKLLTGNPDAANLAKVMVIAPGVEIINRTGDLTLGLANDSSGGSTNVEARSTADWDLSTYRYGTKQAPGVLTLRAQGDLVFNNALSDGFTAVSASSGNGNSGLWLALPKNINATETAYGTLPVNTQSWSYRLTAGADLSAANHGAVLALSSLDAVQPGKGSILVGEFYPAIPNSNTSGGSIGEGSAALTANSIRISTNSTDLGTRYEVIRTGTGSIDISAGRDVQLRNQFATIYTAGVAVPASTKVFQAGDFVVPMIPTTTTRHPGNAGTGGVDLGSVQQLTQPRWTMAGGDIRISAGRNAGRYTLYQGALTADSSRQLPDNWLYRRGYVDPATGLFATNGGVDGSNSANTITDSAPSTTWWVDFSNFFEGVGALGGGNVTVNAGKDVVNLDAVIPTNARMPGKNPSTGQNLAPDASKLLEWGGGDLTIYAGSDISGGVYYVERGTGTISAGGQITTNSARSPSLGFLGSTSQSPDLVQSQTPAIYDPSTWLPTTLFAGKSHFDVSARGDVLLGPVANTFLLPQGLNNQFWYKTYFNTFSPDAGADVTSFGGGVTFRFDVTLPGDSAPRPVLDAWLAVQISPGAVGNAAYYQPWVRLTEADLSTLQTMSRVGAPNLHATAFAGDITLAGSESLFPSSAGALELLASRNLVGLAPTGRSVVQKKDVTVWTASTLNLSDADPGLVPSVAAPLAYQTVAGRDRNVARASNLNALDSTSALFAETGSYSGVAGTLQTQRSLHTASVLHQNDGNPVRIFAAGGDISGLTLFSPKWTEILADRDVTDVSFYIQNTKATDISIVSAGRDLTPYNENASLRTVASDLSQGNLIADSAKATAAGTTSNAAAGDIQINGPGLLETLAGRNIDLGTGANFKDGTGVGITSIANARNPFLSAEGADIIVMAGVPGPGGKGAAQGLSSSCLDFSGFLSKYVDASAILDSDYLKKLGIAKPFNSLTPEQQGVAGLEVFYETLREAGVDHANGGDYQRGFDAVQTLFHQANPYGDIYTRSRDIRTIADGAISVAAPSGGLTMASNVIGNPLAPPGIVTEAGGSVSMFAKNSVSIGQARIFTLRGGDMLIWSSTGNIAAGSAARTVVTAPPTRVLVDIASAAVETDLAGLATGGGIGVLASVKGVQPGNVDLIAPAGVVDAGDAGIRATGNISIAAVQVLNATNIAAGGSSVGVPSAPAAAAPNLGAASSAAAASAATNGAADQAASKSQDTATTKPNEELAASLITAEVVGYGGGGGDSEDPNTGKPGAKPPAPANPDTKPAEDEEQRKKKKVAFASESSVQPVR